MKKLFVIVAFFTLFLLSCDLMTSSVEIRYEVTGSNTGLVKISYESNDGYVVLDNQTLPWTITFQASSNKNLSLKAEATSTEAGFLKSTIFQSDSQIEAHQSNSSAAGQSMVAWAIVTRK